MNQYLMGFISATMLTTSFFLFVGAKQPSPVAGLGQTRAWARAGPSPGPYLGPY